MLCPSEPDACMTLAKLCSCLFSLAMLRPLQLASWIYLHRIGIFALSLFAFQWLLGMVYFYGNLSPASKRSYLPLHKFLGIGQHVHVYCYVSLSEELYFALVIFAQCELVTPCDTCTHVSYCISVGVCDPGVPCEWLPLFGIIF